MSRFIIATTRRAHFVFSGTVHLVREPHLIFHLPTVHSTLCCMDESMSNNPARTEARVLCSSAQNVWWPGKGRGPSSLSRGRLRWEACRSGLSGSERVRDLGRMWMAEDCGAPSRALTEASAQFRRRGGLMEMGGALVWRSGRGRDR